LLIALLIVACANTSLTKPNTSTPRITPTSSESNNASPVEQPAAGSITVHITLVEFRILSSLKTFHAGTTYYFVITNHGQDTHEFKILPDKPDGTPQSPEVQFKDSLIELEPIMPGTTWTINFKFSAAGRFEFACQMGKHYMAGMMLPIVVAS